VLRAELDARAQEWGRERGALGQQLATADAAARDLLGRIERLEEGTRLLASLEVAVAALAEGLLAPAAEARSVAVPPLVSVILPTRNRRAMLQEAIASVRAQTFTGWELLVVDDGSTDGTAEALAPLLADPRVRLLRTPGRGPCAARNAGLREARGELIAYLDDDNRLFPGFLQGVVPAFDEDPALESAYGVVVADAPCFSGSRILFRPFDRTALLEGNSIDMGAFVHRRRLFAELGGFDELLARLADWDLILRYTERNAPRALPILSTYYRTRAPDRLTVTRDAAPETHRIRRKWLTRSVGT
jgi:glycosyltransferase involved in cell wall biosynthesis